MTEKTSKRAKQVRQERRRRKGMGIESRLKLSVPEEMKDKDYVYRWANDDGRRVYELTKNDDWDVVTDETISDDERNNSLGTIGARQVGVADNGKPANAVLLRKRRDWYEQDRAEMQTAIDDKEAQIKRGDHSGDSKGLSGSTAYVPSEGIKVETGSKV